MINSPFAPIAIFAYKRTRHLAQVLDALEICPEFAESPVFIFSDGPKSGRDASDVESARVMLRKRCRPNMTILESPTNRGLAGSIVAGVTELCERYGRVIVIEDDLLVAPCALTWFNQNLKRYENVEAIWQISAHQFPVPEFRHRTEGVFVHLSTSWGWATWKRAWDRYDPEAKGWEAIKTDKPLRDSFNIDRSYPFDDLLFFQMKGQSDSWAILWWWSVFRANALVLFPPRSLVSNIGMDETATHSAFGKVKRLLVSNPSVAHETVCPGAPESVRRDPKVDKLVYRAVRRKSLPTRLRAYLRGLI